VLDSLRSLAQTLIGAVRTRLELLATEVEEQGGRLAHMAMLLAAAGFCIALAIVLGAVLLVVLFWDSNRVTVLAILASVFGAGGIALLLAARSSARTRPRTLASTLAELSHDLESLRAASGEKRS
jgi:uncharacterized membrane protein YqjE